MFAQQTTQPSSSGTVTSVILTSAQCGSCKAKIESALHSVNGIAACSVNPDDHKLTVTYNPNLITLLEIKQKVAASGYDADEIKADAKAYKHLDACCKKKD